MNRNMTYTLGGILVLLILGIIVYGGMTTNRENANTPASSATGTSSGGSGKTDVPATRP